MNWLFEILGSNDVDFKVSLFRLFMSLALGALVGMERQHRKQPAGFRTFSLITTGTTLMMLISIHIGVKYGGDSARLAAQVISGIGFLGAGAIIQSKGTIKGMTTASSIWAMAAVGLAIGEGMYIEGFIGTIFVLFILVSLERFEKKAGIEWVPRTLEIEFSTLDIPFDEVKAFLKSAGLETHYTGFEQNINEGKTIVQFMIFLKLRNNYQKTFNAIKDLPNVKSVKVYS